MELSNSQYGAIKRSILLGKTLQENHPEILELYKNGKTYREIANLLGISMRYDISPVVAMRSVNRAITGYDGKYPFIHESYEGLTSISEALELGSDHRSKASERNYRDIGCLLHEQKRGCHKLTSEQHKKNGHKGGIKGGRKGGLKSTEKKGLTAWSDEELEYAHQRYLNPKTTYKSLSEELNRMFHKNALIRTEGTVKKRLLRFRKRLENSV